MAISLTKTHQLDLGILILHLAIKSWEICGRFFVIGLHFWTALVPGETDLSLVLDGLSAHSWLVTMAGYFQCHWTRAFLGFPSANFETTRLTSMMGAIQ